MKKNYITVGIVAAILILGLLVPLASYTTTNGCTVNPTPKSRLHLILGDSIQEIKDGDVRPAPNVGCSANTKYVLYLL